MKQLILGAALLVFISSLPADATNGHIIHVSAKSVSQTNSTSQTQTGSVTAEPAAYMTPFGDSLPPIGYVVFCRLNQADCMPERRVYDLIQYTAVRARELARINTLVNTRIAPATDMEVYGKPEWWAYPVDRGDCEDYVLLKRKLLIERGWPESVLLITVVRDENNEGHAVLTVRTDHGDLILDNKQHDIKLWSTTPYTYIKRQSASNPLVWTSLLPPDQIAPVTVSTAHSSR